MYSFDTMKYAGLCHSSGIVMRVALRPLKEVLSEQSGLGLRTDWESPCLPITHDITYVETDTTPKHLYGKEIRC
jgi:hypothetical protein